MTKSIPCPSAPLACKKETRKKNHLDVTSRKSATAFNVWIAAVEALLATHAP